MDDLVYDIIDSILENNTVESVEVMNVNNELIQDNDNLILIYSNKMIIVKLKK